MVSTDDFVFVHMPKCAGTSIRTFMEKALGAEDLGYKNLGMHTDAAKLPNDIDKEVVGSIRNPFKWYVSVYEYTKNSDDFFERRFDSFRNFVEYSLFESKGHTDINFKDARKNNIGLYCSTFLSQFCAYGWESKISTLRDENKFDELINNFLIVDTFIDVENIENDIENLLNRYEYNFDREEFEKHGIWNNSNIEDYSSYYDSYLKKLVAYKERYILEYFNYNFI